MSHDAGIGIFSRQFLEQGEHGSLLGFSPGVIGTTFLIETALVANAERTTVVMAGMNTMDVLRENRDNGAVAKNVIVIGGLTEAGHASRNQVFDAERAVAAGRTTMNNQQFNCIMLKFFHKANELSVHTALNDVRTENRCDDGCDDLKDLFYSIPFNHNVIFLKVRHIFAGFSTRQPRKAMTNSEGAQA